MADTSLEDFFIELDMHVSGSKIQNSFYFVIYSESVLRFYIRSSYENRGFLHM